MDQLLVPSDDSDSSCTLLRLSDKQRFACSDFKALGRLLAEDLIDESTPHDLVVDWTRCETHPLIFDIDAKSISRDNPHVYDVLMQFFDTVFLDVLEQHLHLLDLTIILSLRRQHQGGMHVHVLNVALSHDDYTHLWFLMQQHCHYQDRGVALNLDCPSHMSLVACDKPNAAGGPYVPMRMVRTRPGLYLCPQDDIWKRRQMDSFVFHQWTSPSISPFEKLTKHMTRQGWIDAITYMMPVPTPEATVVQFSTRIVAYPTSDKEPDHLAAHFTSCVSGRQYGFVKGSILVRSTADQPFCYRFLKEQARFLDEFIVAENKVLKTWYRQFSFTPKASLGVLMTANERLAKYCVHLKGAESPLQPVASLRHRFLPVYYALCQASPTNSHEEIARALEEMCHVSFDPLPAVPPAATHLTAKTLLYCAFQMVPSGNTWNEDIGKGWGWIWETVKSIEDLINHLLWIQKRHYPIVKTQEGAFSWDNWSKEWVAIDADKIRDRLANVVEWISTLFMRFEGFLNVPESVFKQWNTQSIDGIVDTLVSNLENSEPVKGHCQEVTDQEMSDVYGMNVPEYYFFKCKVPAASKDIPPVAAAETSEEDIPPAAAAETSEEDTPPAAAAKASEEDTPPAAAAKASEEDTPPAGELKV